MQMNHSKQTGLMHYGREISHFPNIIPTLQDAMVNFSLLFHHYFQISPERFPIFQQIWSGQAVSIQAALVPKLPPPRPALLYGKGIPGTPPVLAHVLFQYLHIKPLLMGDEAREDSNDSAAESSPSASPRTAKVAPYQPTSRGFPYQFARAEFSGRGSPTINSARISRGCSGTV